MKITGFNPQIVTKDPESVIGLFEALGFQRTHLKKETEGNTFLNVRMENEGGFHVDVIEAASAPLERDLTTIRINVDNYDEAHELFMNHGFREAKVFAGANTPSSKFGYVVSPTGTVIDICQHIRKEDK